VGVPARGLRADVREVPGWNGQRLLAEATLAHVGLSADAVARTPDGVVRYQPIYETRAYAMGLFLLGRGAAIPLHDHPDMLVLRYARGRPAPIATICPALTHTHTQTNKQTHTHVRARAQQAAGGGSALDRVRLDGGWVRAGRACPEGSGSERPGHPHTVSVGKGRAGPGRPARRVVDQRLHPPCDVLLASPTANNVHAFEAITATVLLDILAPPYDDEAGRVCTYYRYAGG
jgi:hypothetical protein